ncbi:MAG: tetratricopeptide repeat protein [Gammaproteobacteria bacterium]|nr:tetratricopeptide repeat protein [Gammaproteobacteria bacterium]
MGIAYAVAAWVVLQVFDVIGEILELPAWGGKVILATIVLGFFITLFVAWVYELTPEGVKRESEIDRSFPPSPQAGRRLNVLIMGLLLTAVAYLLIDKLYLQPQLIQAANDRIAVNEQSDFLSRSSDASLTGRQSIAVLPFSNRSNVEEDTYFVDGIHDDILTRLTKIGVLKVVSRTSVLRYRETTKPIPEIGRELQVTHILEGGVQRGGQNVRITAQLIEVSTDKHVWAETFDRKLTTENVFEIQSEIAKAIALALDMELYPQDEKVIDAAPTSSLEAFDAYLLGRQSLYSSEIAEAIVQFERAISLDDQYAAAFAGVCQANLYLYVKTSKFDYFDAAQLACENALLLDGELAVVHVSLGTLHRHHGDYASAESQQRSALVADPRNINAQIELGLVLALRGNIRESEATLQQAAAQQPNHWPAHDALFTFYRNFDDQPDHYARAAKHAMRVVELTPDAASAWNNLGTAYHGMQQYEAAKSAWDKALEIAPTRTGYTNRGLQYYYEGRFADAVEMQLKAVELAPDDHRVWGRLAESYRFLDGRQKEVKEAYAEAIRLANQKLQVNPKDWRTRGLLATYFSHFDQPDDAKKEIELALGSSGRDPEALLYAALVSHASGDTESTLLALEEMVERNHTFRQYAADDPDLMSLIGNDRFDRLIMPIP